MPYRQHFAAASFAAALILMDGPSASAAGPRAITYTYPDLVNKLKDLEDLAALPDPGEKTLEITSRDRASAYSAATDAYSAWDANNDCCGHVGANGDGGRILAEMTGPGCIWRLNGASPSTARVKIFLDGSPVPAVDLAWNDYFNNTQAPFIHPSLAYRVAGGFTNNYPIPYQRSCKVVAYDNWSSYYAVEYASFPQGAVVPTFTRDLDAAGGKALADLDDFFANRLGSDPAGARPGQATESGVHSIGAGRTATLFDKAGEGAITGIRIRVNGLSGKADQWAALRELAIGMHWDGESEASVWAPLGDFFGSACGLNPYRSLPMGVQEDGWMYAYWYMPFAAGARVTLKNDGARARNVEASFTRAPLAKPAAALTRFHAKWNRNAQQPVRKDRWPDYTVLKTTGRGRFLGFMLHLFKPGDAVDPGAGLGHYWWGEGDEKFFIDGEKFPSWFGTGSEDYFGYAWATPDYFSKPFHTQLHIEGGIHWKGNRALNRFQIPDNIPFQTSFEGAIEKYYGDAYARYGVVPYWYLAPGGGDPYGEASLSDRTGYYEAPLSGDTTRIEGEDLRVLSRTGGSLVPQYMDWAGLDGWSNRQHLFWYKNNLGDVQGNSAAVLRLSVAKAGTYRLLANLTRAFDYGTVRLGLDGTPCGAAIDLFQDGPGTTGEKEYCARALSSGDHELSLTMTGRNPASKGFYAGLDYLKLIPIPTAIAPEDGAAGALLRRWYRMGSGIAFEVAVPAARVSLYSMRGGLVAVVRAEGGRAIWKGTDAAGNAMAPGRYLAKVAAGGRSKTQPVVLMR